MSKERSSGVTVTEETPLLMEQRRDLRSGISLEMHKNSGARIRTGFRSGRTSIFRGGQKISLLIYRCETDGLYQPLWSLFCEQVGKTESALTWATEAWEEILRTDH